MTVPDEQLGASRYRLHSVEIDLHAVLTRGQVLLGGGVGRVHVPHPVRARLVQTIDKVMKLAIRIDLE